MQSNQTIGIDLPLKVLVWQDASGKTWLSYNDPSWLAKRHGLSLEVDPTVLSWTLATARSLERRLHHRSGARCRVAARYDGLPLSLSE
jgi:hypothetical protein